MSEELVAFQIGDSVVVNEGTKDPDDESMEFGGWQGRIIEISCDEDGSPLVDIQWDGPTLRGMSNEFITGNWMVGLDYAFLCLGADDVSLATPRDTPEEAEAARLEVDENFISQIISPEAQDALLEYVQIREELVAFHSEAMSALTAEEMTRAAKQLGFLEGEKALAFDSEEDVSVLADFALYELRRDGVPIIQWHFRDSTAGVKSSRADMRANKDEAPLLDVADLNQAISQSFTSLFQIEEMSAEGLTLIDVLDPKRPAYRLIDIGLMSIGEPQMLIFSRLVSIRNFHMTSGAAFCFPAQRLNPLLRSYRNAIRGKLSHGVEVERYRFFHRANQRFGLGMEYR